MTTFSSVPAYALWWTQSSLPYLHGTTLDVVEDGLARRVRFDNPNVRQTCGCGESFGV